MTNENLLYRKGELYSMLYGDLSGKEIQKKVDIYICTADTLCGQ